MITLLQLSVGRILTTWFNYRPGIYYFNFDGTYPEIDSVFLTDVETISGITEIGSVFADNDELTQVFTIDDLVNGPSFYYDSVNNTLYIRLANYDAPDTRIMSVGPVYAISDVAYTDPATSTEYEPKLRSTVDVTRKKDALFFGKITYSDFTVTISNADGELYDLQNWDVYGQPLSLLYGKETQNASSFSTLKTGRVKEYSFIGSDLEIRAEDSRRVLSKKLPVRNVNATDYPNADRDKDKTIPVVYGACRRVPCRVTNDDTGTTSFSFIVVDCEDHPDGIKAIDQVYVEGKAVASTPSVSDGTFTLSSSVYEVGDAVTADVRGYVDDSGNLIDNPLDILKDIITVYLEYPYNSNFFDTVAWDTATAAATEAVGYAAVKKTDITKIAEAIGASLLEGLYINPQDRFTWLTHTDANAPVFQVRAEDWADIPSVEFSSDEAISTAIVQYDRNWNDGEFRVSEYSDGYDDFVLKFKAPQDQTFDTVLTDDTDAANFAEELGTSYADVQIFVEGEIGLQLQNVGYLADIFSLQPGQNIDIEVKNLEFVNGNIRFEQDIIGRFKAELIELTLQPGSETARIKARFIEPYETIITDGAALGDFVLGLDFLAEAGVIDV